MKNQKLKILILTLFVFSASHVFAQDDLLQIENQIRQKSRFDLGVSVADRAKANTLLGLSLGYEYFVLPNLSIESNLFINLFQTSNFTDFQSTRDLGSSGLTIQNYDNRMSFSGFINYYLGKNVQNGHYLSFGVNNLIAFTNRRQRSVVQNVLTSSKIDIGVVRTLPVIGVYYGYRKEFDSGFFIDGKVGLGYRMSPVTLFKPSERRILDFKFSIGWRINFKKKG